MELILNIETSTKNCSISIFNRNEEITSQSLYIEKSHSKYLVQMIEQNFSNIPFSKHDLKAIGVSEGPGSYTGLRTGIAVAKAFCFGLDIPLISMNSLDILTTKIINYSLTEDLLFCPMLDARRMEVYCQVISKNFEVIEELQAKIIDENSFSSLLDKNKIAFFGDGAQKCNNIISNKNAFFIKNLYPEAKFMGNYIYKKFLNHDFQDLDSFEPLYLKSPLVS